MSWKECERAGFIKTPIAKVLAKWKRVHALPPRADVELSQRLVSYGRLKCTVA